MVDVSDAEVHEEIISEVRRLEQKTELNVSGSEASIRNLTNTEAQSRLFNSREETSFQKLNETLSTRSSQRTL